MSVTRGQEWGNSDSSEQWLGTALSTLYLRPLSQPIRSALLFPHLIEEETETRGVSNLPKASREPRTHEEGSNLGLEGIWSLGGANEWPRWENGSREGSHKGCRSRGVWKGPVPAGAPMDGCLGLCWRSGRLSPYNCHTLWDVSREAWPVHLRLVRPNLLQWLQPPRPLPLSSPGTPSTMPGPFLACSAMDSPTSSSLSRQALSKCSLPDHPSPISTLRLRISWA